MRPAFCCIRSIRAEEIRDTSTPSNPRWIQSHRQLVRPAFLRMDPSTQRTTFAMHWLAWFSSRADNSMCVWRYAVDCPGCHWREPWQTTDNYGPRSDSTRRTTSECTHQCGMDAAEDLRKSNKTERLTYAGVKNCRGFLFSWIRQPWLIHLIWKDLELGRTRWKHLIQF